MVQERAAKAYSGWMMVIVFILALILGAVTLLAGVITENAWSLIAIPFGIVILFLFSGFFIINPNEAKVGVLFGNYAGSVRKPGFWWMNPFTLKKHVSLRIRNFESGKLKVNDEAGNPIEIGAIVVWRVKDTAEAMFEVEDYENFVRVQTEAAVRNLATSYPYDTHKEGEISLRGNTADVAERLKKEVQERLAKAGVEIIEARIAHLAYASEIASAMLRRQQANAIIAARQRIVEGAVGMVEMALDQLEQGGKVKLDDERKAAMVSNLLVVLTSDRDAQPIVNTGSLYQ